MVTKTADLADWREPEGMNKARQAWREMKGEIR